MSAHDTLRQSAGDTAWHGDPEYPAELLPSLFTDPNTFSSVEKMDHFEIHKEINLFLRKVYYRQIYTKERQVTVAPVDNRQDMEAVAQSISLLEKCNTASDDDETSPVEKSRFKANL